MINHRMRKHETGKCDNCGHAESIEHVLIVCDAYERERFLLNQALRSLGIDHLSPQVMLGNGPKQSRIFHELIIFLKETRLINIIEEIVVLFSYMFVIFVIYLKMD